MAGQKKEDRRYDKDGNILNKDGSIRKKSGTKPQKSSKTKGDKDPNKSTNGYAKARNLGKIKDEVIERLYTNGEATVNVVKFLVDKYKYTKQGGYRVIKEVRIELGDYHRKTSVDALENAITKLEFLYQQSLENDDRKTALQIQIEMNKLLQLSTQKLDITSMGDKISINIKLDDED